MSDKTDELFFKAREIADPAERQAFLQEACGDAPELVARVQGLLAAEEQAEGYFGDTLPDHPGIEEPADSIEHSGLTIGRYKLLQKIGEGGYGSVWKAEQTTPVTRHVALKIIKQGMDTREVIARFEAERQALAMMEHPNIAKVLDAGATAQGRPFFVMELVRGLPVTQFCTEQKCPTTQRLALFCDICSAVHHAHQKGIIHRDLKPSNVLVALESDKAVPKVIDFGIAKAIDTKLTEKTLFTRVDQFVGTPAYMSPEQASSRGQDLDTRVDIYALGVLLYELLSGKLPFDPESLLSAGYDEMRRVIIEEDPPRPSLRFSTATDLKRAKITASHGSDPPRLTRTLRGDLDWIVMKAIEKDRTRRYGSANLLAADINRYLADEPVTATPPSLRYKLGKFARRNKGQLAAGLALAMALIAGSIISSWQAIRATRHAGRATNAESLAAERLTQSEQARHLAETLSGENRKRLIQLYTTSGVNELRNGNPSLALPWLVKALELEPDQSINAQVQRVRIARALERTPQLVRFWTKKGHANQVAFSPNGQYALAAASRQSRKDWSGGGMEVWHLETGKAVALEIDKASVLHARFTPMENRLATIRQSGEIDLWNLETGKVLVSFAEPHPNGNHLVLSPDGSRLLSYGRKGLARLWDTESGRLHLDRFPLESTAHIVGAAFHPDGSQLTLLTYLGEVFSFETATGQAVHPAAGFPGWGHGEPGGLQYAADGSRFACPVGDKATIRIWNPESGAELHSLSHPAPLANFDLSPDGTLIATATRGFPATIQTWDLRSGEPVASPIRHDDPISMVRFSPDSRFIVAGSWGHDVRIWEARTGEAASPAMQHASALQSVAFHPSEPLVLTGCVDGTVRVWSIDATPRPTISLSTDGRLEHVAIDPSGKRLLASDSTGEIHLWRTDDWRSFDEEEAQVHEPTPDYLPCASLRSFIDHDPVIQFWNLDRPAEGSGTRPLPPWAATNAGLPHVALTPDHRRAVIHYSTLSQSGSQTWDLESSKALLTVRGVATRLFRMSRDGKTFAIVYGGELSLPHRLQFHETETGGPLGDPIVIERFTQDGRFSPDGTMFTLVTKAIPYGETGSSGQLTSWRVATREPILHRDIETPGLLRYRPDGEALLISHHNVMRIYDRATGTPLTPPITHRQSVAQAKFSPDGRYLCSTDRTDRLYITDARTGHAITTPLRHPGIVLDASFTPDNRRIMTTCDDDRIRFWDLLPDLSPVRALRVRAHLSSARSVDQTGTLSPLTLKTLQKSWQTWLAQIESDLPSLPIAGAAPLLELPGMTPERQRALEEWEALPGEIVAVPGNATLGDSTGIVCLEGVQYRLFPCPIDSWNTTPGRRPDVDYRGHVRDRYVTRTGRPYMQLCYAIGESRFQAVQAGEIISGDGPLRLIPSDSIGKTGDKYLINNSGAIRVKISKLPD